MTRAVALIVALLAPTLSGRAQQPQPPRDTSASTAPATGTIRGRVLAADTGNPLRNARVGVLAPGTVPVMTDADGRFTLPSVPAGSHSLMAVKTGYAATFFGASADGPAASIEVAAGAVVAGIDMALPKGAAISGRLVNDLGAPMPLVNVAAERIVRVGGRIEFRRVTAAETDDRGDYRLFDLPAGDYVADVAPPVQGQLPPATRPFALPAALVDAGGNAVWTADFFPDPASIAEGHGVTLAAGADVVGINLVAAPIRDLARNVSGIIVGPADPNRVLVTPPAAQPPPGSIRGRVLSTDGFPISGTRVLLSSRERLFTPYAMPTNDDGWYEFSDLAPGDYLLTANKPGYVTRSFGQRSETDRGDLVTIRRGAAADHVDITLPRGAAIAGRVVDENGDPVENLVVKIGNVKSDGGRQVLTFRPPPTRTNDLGRFRAFDLAPGRYLLSAAVGPLPPATASVVTNDYAETFFPGTPSIAEAQLIEVRGAEDTVNVDFSLVKGHVGHVTGRVIDVAGAPFAGSVAMIATRRSGAISTGTLKTRSLADGRFEFSNVPPGDFVVQAARSRISPSIEGEFGAQFVSVNGDTADVTIRMGAGSTVTGRVTFDDGSPPPATEDVEITSLAADPDLASLVGNPTARAEIHEDWTFEMAGLAGPRRLQLTQSPAGWMAKSVLVGGVDVGDAPLPFGTLDQSLANVEIVLTNRVTDLAGSVVDDRGEPVSDAVVVAFPADRARWYAGSRRVRQVDVSPHGAYAIGALPAGDYFVAVAERRVAADVTQEVEDPAFLTSLMANAIRLSLAEGQRATLPLTLIAR